MATLKLTVNTPVETVLDQEVEQVVIDTEAGQITVLPDHTPLVSILRPGELLVTVGGETTPFAVSGGVLEISDNTLAILADSAEKPSDIDLEAAKQRAEELAKELATEEAMDIKTYNLLQKQLMQEQARLNVGNNWK